MKKLITLLLIAAMFLPAASMAGELANAQAYFFKTAPQNVRSVLFEITGRTVKMEYTNNNHLQLYLEVEDDKAWDGITFPSDLPGCIATMPYNHVFEDLPLQLGDTITFVGDINYFYSSVMVLDFTIKSINGVDITEWIYGGDDE